MDGIIFCTAGLFLCIYPFILIRRSGRKEIKRREEHPLRCENCGNVFQDKDCISDHAGGFESTFFTSVYECKNCSHTTDDIIW